MIPYKNRNFTASQGIKRRSYAYESERVKRRTSDEGEAGDAAREGSLGLGKGGSETDRMKGDERQTQMTLGSGFTPTTPLVRSVYSPVYVVYLHAVECHRA